MGSSNGVRQRVDVSCREKKVDHHGVVQAPGATTSKRWSKNDRRLPLMSFRWAKGRQHDSYLSSLLFVCTLYVGRQTFFLVVGGRKESKRLGGWKSPTLQVCSKAHGWQTAAVPARRLLLKVYSPTVFCLLWATLHWLRF